METTSDSDISEGTQELVRQGLASVRRRRVGVAVQLERLPERISVPNMDTSRIRRPLNQDGLICIASTYGLSTAERENSEAQNHNNIYNTIGITNRPSYGYLTCVRLGIVKS